MTEDVNAKAAAEAAMKKAMAGLEEKYGPATVNPDGSLEFRIGTPTTADPIMFGSPDTTPPRVPDVTPVVIPEAPRKESSLVPVLLAGILLVEVFRFLLELFLRLK